MLGKDVISLMPIHQKWQFVSDDTGHERIRQANYLHPGNRPIRRGNDFERLLDMFVHDEKLRPVGMGDFYRHVHHTFKDIGG